MSTSAYLGWNAVMNAIAGTTDLFMEDAANVYAQNQGYTGGHLSTVGALNEAYRLIKSQPSAPYLQINGICNALAGTTGLSALLALNILNGYTGVT